MGENQMDKVHVGVIGAGYWGPNLIRNFAALQNAEVVAVADTKQERLQNIQCNHPQVMLTSNYRDLFSMGLDAVVVATPPATHFRLAADCLDHGLHVMVEKPLALKSADAEELIQLADERGLTLMVGNTFEYNSAVQALRRIIDNGDLGDIYYIDAVRTNLGLFQPHVNAMWDLAPHDISILLYLLGKDPLTVSAHGKSSIFKNIHDVVYMHLDFPNNVLAHVHVSWLNPCKVRRITVVGSKKMAVYDDVENLEKIKIYDKGVDAPPYTDTYGDFQCSYRYGDVVTPYIQHVEPLRVECQHFVESIVNKTQPRSDGWVGLRIVKVLEAASISLQNNGQQHPVSPTVKRQPVEQGVRF
jgi:predicted dehydrogenase